jgi:hypothetical protein
MIHYGIMSYALIDFIISTFIQMPTTPTSPFLELLGFNKIYYSQAPISYTNMLDGSEYKTYYNNYNLMVQLMVTFIIATVCLQTEIFLSNGYREFMHKKNKGLDLLIEMADLKRLAITYRFNNHKLLKTVAMQKRQNLVIQTVEKLKSYLILWRRFKN